MFLLLTWLKLTFICKRTAWLTCLVRFESQKEWARLFNFEGSL